MKQFVVFTILMLGVSMQMSAQDNALVFLAGHAEITYTQDWEDAELLSVAGEEIIITAMDDSEYNITFTNKFGDKFKTYGEETSVLMSDGHACTHYMYNAVDDNGVECEVLIRYYEDGHMWGELYRYNFRVFYNNVWYGYYANAFDPSNPKDLGDKPLTITPGTKQL